MNQKPMFAAALTALSLSFASQVQAQLPALPTIPPDPAPGAAATPAASTQPPALPVAPSPASGPPALPALPGAGAPAQPAASAPGLPGLPGLPGMPAGSEAATPSASEPAALPAMPGSSIAPPPQQPLPGRQNLGEGEVARMDRRKDTADALLVIREALYRQDYDAMKVAIDQAEKADPSSPQIQFYKNMLTRKMLEANNLQQQPGIRTPRAGTAGLSGDATAGLPGIGTAASGIPATPAGPDATPVAQIQVADTSAAEPAPTERMSRGKRKLIGLAIAVGLAVLWALFKFGFAKFAARRQASVPPAPSASVSHPIRRTPADSPSLLFQSAEDGDVGAPPPPPPPPPGAAPADPFMVAEVVEQPEDHRALAQNIAQNLASMKSTPVSSTGFELFGPQTAEGQPGYMDSAPTLADNAPTLIENSPTLMDNSPTLVDGQARINDPALFAAPPKIETPKAAELEQPKPATTPAPASNSETVSFEDLGIFMNEPPAPVTTPTLPAPPPENKPIAEALPPAPASAPVEPTVAGGAGSIRLEDLTVATSPKHPTPTQPVASQPVAGGIDLEQLFANIPHQAEPKTETPAGDQARPGDSLKLPASGADSNAEKTYGVLADTFHSQDTIALTNSGMGMPAVSPGAAKGTSSPFEELVASMDPNGPAPKGPELDATKTAANATPVPSGESIYAATPARGTAQLDERSEKMFREQYDRATKAIGEKNWRQAVHYLSIAAAIHPENEQVREQLKSARAEKRKQETNA